MPRRGKELELLIKKIEQSNLPEDAKISSPAYLIDKSNNKKREVDILIEYKIGTVAIKVIIECRERKAKQDATWIEQLPTKAQHLGVNKVIAVSSSGFTDEAITKANLLGIETRTFGEIGFDLIKNWWFVEYIEMISPVSTIYKVTISSDNNELINDLLKGKTYIDKYFHRTTDELVYSIVEIFGIGFSNTGLGSILTPAKPIIREKVEFVYQNESDRFMLKTGNQSVQILKILFDVEIKLVSKKIPITNIKEYKSEESIFSHLIEYDVSKDSDFGAFQFIRSSDGSISLSVKPKTIE